MASFPIPFVDFPFRHANRPSFSVAQGGINNAAFTPAMQLQGLGGVGSVGSAGV